MLLFHLQCRNLNTESILCIYLYVCVNIRIQRSLPSPKNVVISYLATWSHLNKSLHTANSTTTKSTIIITTTAKKKPKIIRIIEWERKRWTQRETEKIAATLISERKEIRRREKKISTFRNYIIQWMRQLIWMEYKSIQFNMHAWKVFLSFAPYECACIYVMIVKSFFFHTHTKK